MLLFSFLQNQNLKDMLVPRAAVSSSKHFLEWGKLNKMTGPNQIFFFPLFCWKKMTTIFFFLLTYTYDSMILYDF